MRGKMFIHAEHLLHKFKGGCYLHGLGVLGQIGPKAAQFGSRAALVWAEFPGCDEYIDKIKVSLVQSGVQIAGEIMGAQPNAPREDLARITAELTEVDPDVLVTFGGGSTIDSVKSAEVLRTLGGEIDDYFGVGLVTQAIKDAGKKLTPHAAVQSAASSAAHLTKYSNITQVQTGQKKLVVDEAIVPIQPVFDYKVTLDAPPSLTADGALDGVAHSLEVLYGAVGKPYYPLAEAIAVECISLVVENLPWALDAPHNARARRALGLATDLGGYAIMLGGTNGAHLTSFSLVDVLSHGRACAIMNPYYSVFFAPAIQQPLQMILGIFTKAGYAPANMDRIEGRDLGVAVAKAMIAFQDDIGFPTTLGEVEGFSDGHIERALAAAKDPQLKMKLENMPVPLTDGMVDEYMGSILMAARTGDLSVIKNV